MIPLTVNGAERAVAGGTTVAGLLSGLGLDARMVVVERNGTILRQPDEFGRLALEPGDVLELVHFVGGG
jgi:sulfur carrier protein